MKKSRYTEEQIAFTLKQAELGTPISEVCRKLGVSEQTFYRWKNRFGGMLPSDMKRLSLGESWVDSEAVFTKWNGTRMAVDSPASWFREFLKVNNLPPINPDGLRHTGASLLIAQGIDVQTIRQRLGHARASTTMDIYAHAFQECDELATDAFDQVLAQASGRTKQILKAIDLSSSIRRLAHVLAHVRENQLNLKKKKGLISLWNQALSLAFPARFERAAFRLGGERSILLSYGNRVSARQMLSAICA